MPPLSEQAETELIEHARRGDRPAFGELARRYYPGVIRVIYRLSGDPDLAQDIAQETFLRSWLRLASFRPGSSLRSWLYRIAVNAALDQLRRKPDEPLDPERWTKPDPAFPDPQAALESGELSRTLARAVESLPRACRVVLVLREYGELSYAEIAAALDIPIGTVMSRLSSARERLRGELTGQGMRREPDDV